MTSQPSGEITATPAQRIGWTILILSTLYVCYFSHLGVIGFVGPDEPRYAWIARDMAESGDWVTPRLYGKPWFEKPPLLYWGGALFFKLFGPSAPEVAARLPSAISALLATLALAWLAWRTYGEECARWLLLLLPTSVGMIGFSHAAATDMPFAGMFTTAMVCAAVALGLVTTTENTPILPRTPWLALILFGFFLGLAVLAKGPAAIILSGGAVFFLAIFSKRWRDAFRMLHPAAIASFCLTALPWYILCARRNPDFFHIFIIEHNFKRYLTPEFQHVQPFWFYIPIVLIAFLPWIATLIWSASLGFRTRGHHRLTSFLLAWSLFSIFFFSISRSKLPGYILPAIPAIGLLLARRVQSLGQIRIKSFRLCAAIGSVFFAITSLLLFEIGRLTALHSHLNGKAGTAYALLALSFSLANLFLIFARWNRAHGSAIPLQPLAALPIVAAMLFAPYFVWSNFVYDPSGQTIGNTLRRQAAVADDLLVGNMNRGKHYGLNFYLHRDIPDWDPAHPRVGYLLLRNRNCAGIVPAPYVCSTDPAFFEESGEYLYKVTSPASPARLGGRGEPQ
jgi:4-amino-4-deoxy-L-arabinose transferase-like glycosyltransferase